MKTMKSFTISMAVMVMLLIDLMSPTIVHAEDETPPPASETPVETTTPPVTPLPTDIAPTETPTPAETDSPTEIAPTESPTDSVPPADDPDETDTPTETAAPAPTESPTLEDPPGTPPPTDSSTPDTQSNTPAPTVTDSGSPTSGPVETSTPTPTPTRERTRRPTETTISRLEPLGPATEEPIVTESSTPTQTPTETASPTEPVTVDNPTLLESVQAIPGETSVVVLDANGQPLPLAAQEAADAVALGDPIWCPAGLAPTPGANGCTVSYTSLATLLSDLSALNAGTGINADGTIWIEASYISSVNDPTATGFTLNGSILTTWANYSLTLQGGWNGVNGSTGLLSNSVFSVPITITNWRRKVTVHNLTINNNAGTGLTVVTDGNINLSNINSTNSTWDGVYLNNSGAGRGNITVTGINNFSNHNPGASGMYILSNGTVDLSGITSNNNGRGINISSAGDVIITNGTFNGNFFNGLYMVNTSGNVTLNNINIDGTNGTGTGLYVNTTGAINGNNITSNNNIQRGGGPCPIDCGDGAYLIGNNGVTLTGPNTFDNNGWTGLDAHSSNGVITLNYITAKNNAQWGAYSTGANDIVLNGTNVFDGNAAGLYADSGGTLTLNNVTANNNWYSYGAIALGAAGVTLTGTNTFNANGYNGLDAWSSNGATSLENVTANGNGAWGAFVVGTNGVTLTGTNQFNGQYQGLAVSNSGDVTLNNITANSNITGVKVESSGNVTLNNVDASLNQVGVAVSNSGNVFLTDENISNNAEIGLYVKCVASLNFSVNPPNIINNPIDILIDPTCPVPVVYPLTIVAQSQGKFFALDCEHADGYSVILPNGDLVQIFCDVSGRASISRLDNTALPSSLPEGYTYASAFQADIVQGGRSISVIPETESGYIKASFVGSSLQQGSAYSILYWDDGQWVPLKDFMLAENGNPLVFDLNPGVSDDTRKILSGVKLVTVRGEPRVEVSTNFPGIFVLAQR